MTENCILKRCPHDAGIACRALGQCGAQFALDRASQPGGYRVHAPTRDNPNRTISALLKAGLVTLTDEGHATAIVKASS